MKTPHLVTRKPNSSYLFRTIIPQDLIEHFNGNTRFQISLKNVNNKETQYVSIFLKSLVVHLFNDIRMGKSLSLDDVKEILKVEVRKSILHGNHIYLETNKYDPNIDRR